MSTKQLQERLKSLIRMWAQREAEYTEIMLNNERTQLERNRYEGIATGTRWCSEDLKIMLGKPIDT